jgi:nucleoside-diphosphate-sugar epimerase
LPQLPIIDIRVFNYFSHTQDMSARFLITDILRAIRDKTVLMTSGDDIVRDYLHPADFYQLVEALLNEPRNNMAVDCYSLAPIDKPSLLVFMHEKFGLRYETIGTSAGINATGNKPYYFSHQRLATKCGYRPKLTSLQGVEIESIKLLITS